MPKLVLPGFDFRVGFTGSREGLAATQIRFLHEFFDEFDVREAHHGDCLGADAAFHDICLAKGVERIVIHPPTDPKLRAFCHTRANRHANIEVLVKKDYIQRNHDIVGSCHALLVCPKTRIEEVRSGTWATYRYAKKQGVKTVILFP